jgi:hypothetical protein
LRQTSSPKKYSQNHNIGPSFRDYAAQLTESGEPVKPFISLSGDDDGKHYILFPASEDKNDWTYNKELLVETGSSESLLWPGANPTIFLIYSYSASVVVSYIEPFSK